MYTSSTKPSHRQTHSTPVAPLYSNQNLLKGFPPPIRGLPLGFIVYLLLDAFFFFSYVPLSESGWNFPAARRAVSQTAADPEPKVQEEEVLRPGVKQRAELSVYEAAHTL